MEGGREENSRWGGGEKGGRAREGNKQATKQKRDRGR